MRRLAASERGSVMVTAIVLLGLMVALGLTAMARVDTQTTETRRERVRESAFNYAEATLSAQIFVLGRSGTGSEQEPYPEVCGLTSHKFCPDRDKIALNYDKTGNSDFNPSNVQWRTWVRDNAASLVASQPDTFWQDSLMSSRPRWDANSDKLMWVRAEARTRDRVRAMVGLIRIEDRPVTFPQYAILAGRFRTTNNGKHSDAIVNAGNGSLGVQVRCDLTVPPDQANACLSYKPSQGQISPAGAVYDDYNGPDKAVSEDDLDALMDVARANRTYFTDECPDTLAGKVVVIDTLGECHYQGNDVYNTPNKPGLLILTRGKFEIRGGAVYHGLIYHANLLGSSAPDLVKVHGNSQVNGGILVDGDGGLEAGSSGKQNLVFNPNVFASITTFGTAGVVQNTWREIRPLGI